MAICAGGRLFDTDGNSRGLGESQHFTLQILVECGSGAWEDSLGPLVISGAIESSMKTLSLLMTPFLNGPRRSQVPALLNAATARQFLL